MAIVNLTQHNATPDQISAGVVEPAVAKSIVSSLLDINTLSDALSVTVLNAKVEALVALAEESGCDTAMIGGAPFLMAPLAGALKDAGITPVYAFSKRVPGEVQLPDGTVKKTLTFCHEGFVPA